MLFVFASRLFSCIVSPFFIYFLVAGWLVGFLFFCLLSRRGGVDGYSSTVEEGGGEMWESDGNWERWEVGQVPWMYCLG